MELENENNVNFVPCIKWIRKGVASEHPEKVQLTKNELVQIIKETKDKISEAHESENDKTMQTENENDEFDMENYDQNEDTTEGLGIHSLAEINENAADNFSESDDSEKEDDIIKPTDNLILVAHVEGDASILEVYVYNEDEESLYVHHDFYLPSFPLCLEWLNYEPNQPKGSYVAVGTMAPIIEIWDLDVVNCIEPAFSLGQAASRKKNKAHVGHSDAVLALAWNKSFDHVIASGSVDKSILLWDMERKEPSTTINVFEDKVQCLEWHKMEAQTLLAGGCDNTARIFDCRTPEPHQKWPLNGESERLLWNPLEPFQFIAGTSTGYIQCFDCRKGELWSVKAHEKEVTGLAVSGQCPGLLLTASMDEVVKTWDFAKGGQPRVVNERDFGLGGVHCLELCPDLPFVIAAGGDKKSNNFSVFDLQNIDPVKHTFESRPLIQLITEEHTESTSNTS